MRLIPLLTISFILGLSGCRGETTVQQGPGGDEAVIEQEDRDSFIGKHFLDFQQPDTQGRLRSLSDYAGKGRWVLVDFWASWCRPCREEMPNVVKAYKKYRFRGLKIVGISFDSDEEAWKDAIKDMDMRWTNLSDLKGGKNLAGEIYDVGWIPDNIIIAPNGIIVARVLRGPELKAVLSDNFGHSIKKGTTIPELAAAIGECDIASNKLRTTIASQKTRPEKCLEARQALINITLERKIWVNKLEQYVASIAEE